MSIRGSGVAGDINLGWPVGYEVCENQSKKGCVVDQPEQFYSSFSDLSKTQFTLFAYCQLYALH